MRYLLIVLVVAVTSACSSPSGPTSSTVGSLTDISGAWHGTFASSNNDSQGISVTVAQDGSTINAPWSGDAVQWSGTMSGTLSGSSISGQLSFKGVAADGTVCTGNATIGGTISSTA